MLKRQLEGNLKVNNIGLCVNCVGSYYIYLSKYIDYTPKYVTVYKNKQMKKFQKPINK